MKYTGHLFQSLCLIPTLLKDELQFCPHWRSTQQSVSQVSDQCERVLNQTYVLTASARRLSPARDHATFNSCNVIGCDFSVYIVQCIMFNWNIVKRMERNSWLGYRAMTSLRLSSTRFLLLAVANSSIFVSSAGLTSIHVLPTDLRPTDTNFVAIFGHLPSLISITCPTHCSRLLFVSPTLLNSL